MRLTVLNRFLIGSLTVAALELAPPGLAQTLTHRYSFNDTAGSTAFADSVGGPAWNGTLVGTASLDGSQLQLDGVGGWATLPATIISTNLQVTIEFWASFSPTNPVWTRVFAFGDQDGAGGQRTSVNYCHFAAGDWQNLGMTTTNANIWANNPGGLNGAQNVHVLIVVDPVNNQMYYYNGTTLTSNPGVNGGSVPPLSAVNDTINLIGKSLIDIDPLLEGSINEFRIYSGVASPATVAINDAAGPDRYVPSAGALQAVHLVSPINPLAVNENSQQLFTGDFANVSGVNLIAYGAATFSSGNTSVLTVDAKGVVHPLAPGTTTVVASFGGKSATNTLSVVAVPAVLAHRYSFTTDASDSIGGANGTLIGAATVAGGKLVLDGTAGTYLDLPGDIINVNTNQSITVEAWVDFGALSSWCRLFDFGADGGSTELYMAPQIFNGARHRLSENINAGRTFDMRDGFANTAAHLTCVFDPPSSTMALYRDGLLEYAVNNASAPLSLVSTNLAVIGRSLVAVDPYMPGSVDELRIYHGALTPQEVAMTQKNGVSSTARDPGALQSIKLAAVSYPAYSDQFAPTIFANYANLTNFNLMPNNHAFVNGLTLTSSDTNVLLVLANNLVRTFRPGTVTLTATYFGKTDSVTVGVENVGKLAHRYTFDTDASDSVGTANGTLQGTASIAGGSLLLDGAPGSYLDLPAALIDGWDAVTVDAWVTFNTTATWSRLWYIGDDRENEFYLAPSVNGGSAHWFSAGLASDGNTITISPQWTNLTLHVTCLYGNGSMAYYTNGVLHGAISPVNGRLDQVGKSFTWIGRSPYPADAYVSASVDEFRVYRGRLAPDEILASDVIGPNQLLSTSASLTAKASGGNLLLSWPVAAAGFSLQAKSSLAAGPWTTLTNVPALNGSQWQVTVPVSGSPQFFRLWR